MALEPPDPRHAHTPLPLAVNALAAAEHTDATVRWLDALGPRVDHRGSEAEAALLRAERAVVALSHGRIAEARRTILPNGAVEEPRAHASAVSTAVRAIVTLHSDEPWLTEKFLTGDLSHHQDQYHAALLHMARGLLARPAAGTTSSPSTTSGRQVSGWSGSAGRIRRFCHGPPPPPSYTTGWASRTVRWPRGGGRWSRPACGAHRPWRGGRWWLSAVSHPGAGERSCWRRRFRSWRDRPMSTSCVGRCSPTAAGTAWRAGGRNERWTGPVRCPPCAARTG
ncbi:hypothetical protein IHE61_21815 [Streptomyces sp. GKU 257-1]|nr:hypothetical protein [Streptomyces sp. GKU 257-1]